ncbi:MAG: DUF2752 domain-containing protein [Bacteroidales bacterium]
MGYSGIFSPDRDNYPIICVHEAIIGEPCPSCGLSHAFSLIVRGRLAEALDWNLYSLRMFLFFALQLVMRVGLSLWYLKIPDRAIRNNLVVADTVVTSLMFILAFWPMLRFLVISAGLTA